MHSRLPGSFKQQQSLIRVALSSHRGNVLNSSTPRVFGNTYYILPYNLLKNTFARSYLTLFPPVHLPELTVFYSYQQIVP